MFLVVGLGNPGQEYTKTRHNIGFMAIDEIFNRYNFNTFKTKFSGLISEGLINNQKVILLKPQTFMNLSGNSVQKVAQFYKIAPQNIIVIHDDKDLILGKLKAKIGGSAGGHNGLKNIDAQIGQNYNRIRIGVGSPKDYNMDTINFVLSKFSQAEIKLLENKLDLIAQTIPQLIDTDINKYSNLIGQQN